MQATVGLKSQRSGPSRVPFFSRSGYAGRCRCNGRSAGKEVVVGFDLGTTNSAVSFIRNGKPVCIPNADGEHLTPSVVCWLPNGEYTVGKQAKRLASSDPLTTFYSVKRLIGLDYAAPSVQEDKDNLAYQVLSDEEGSVVLGCPKAPGGHVYPEEVSARVLAQLLDDAESYTGGRVTKAVISVPAYFTKTQCEATEAAGRLAGLEVVRLLHEPVAAALAYGIDLREDQTVLVVDLGGGTYDISLLEVGNGTVEVLSTGGDPHLGGDDWDQVLVDWLVEEHIDKKAVDCTRPDILANLKKLAEHAKVQLSLHEEVVVRMPVGGPGGGPLKVTVTREDLDRLSTDLYRRCRLPLDQACWQAGVDLFTVLESYKKKRETMAQAGAPQWKQDTLKVDLRPKKRDPISKVLLVGGATRMPAFRQFITNMTGITPVEADINPDQAVALGAAVQAGILQGELDDMMLLNQWQASLTRALAQMKLKSDEEARRKIEEKFDFEED